MSVLLLLIRERRRREVQGHVFRPALMIPSLIEQSIMITELGSAKAMFCLVFLCYYPPFFFVGSLVLVEDIPRLFYAMAGVALRSGPHDGMEVEGRAILATYLPLAF